MSLVRLEPWRQVMQNKTPRNRQSIKPKCKLRLSKLTMTRFAVHQLLPHRWHLLHARLSRVFQVLIQTEFQRVLSPKNQHQRQNTSGKNCSRWPSLHRPRTWRRWWGQINNFSTLYVRPNTKSEKSHPFCNHKRTDKTGSIRKRCSRWSRICSVWWRTLSSNLIFLKLKTFVLLSTRRIPRRLCWLKAVLRENEKAAMIARSRHFSHSAGRLRLLHNLMPHPNSWSITKEWRTFDNRCRCWKRWVTK